jgi:phage terminase large subunit-like protein
MPGQTINLEELRRKHALLERLVEERRYNRLALFKPYPKQAQFIALGATKRERLLMAGNQLGKTEVGAYECAVHMTGLYPPDWTGRKFDHPVKCWIAGETSTAVRDTQQKKLCGEPGVLAMFGTGMIPKETFTDKPSLARGVTDAYDTIQVKHKSGGTSIGRFKSYEQGRTKFQADTLDFVWCDEEPAIDIYSECLARITATNGMLYSTFTPMLGTTKMVAKFRDEFSPDRAMLVMTIEEAEHISPENRIKILAGYPAHQRQARAYGIPLLGSGAIFTVDPASIMEESIDHVPSYWGKLWGIDFGINHPFAAVLGLYDRDNDCIHIHHAFRLSDALPIIHASLMKPIGADVPVAWPQDGTQRDKGSGEVLAQLYKKQGLRMLPQHAMFESGGSSTEAAVADMDERMKTGRLKVAKHLQEWFEEYREYHRKDGLIVHERDDIMSATQRIIMAKRFAQNVQLGGKRRSQTRKGMPNTDWADGDGIFDPHAGRDEEDWG